MSTHPGTSVQLDRRAKIKEWRMRAGSMFEMRTVDMACAQTRPYQATMKDGTSYLIRQCVHVLLQIHLLQRLRAQ